MSEPKLLLVEEFKSEMALLLADEGHPEIGESLLEFHKADDRKKGFGGTYS